MKRVMVLIMAVMPTVLTACGGQPQGADTSVPPPDTPAVTPPVDPVQSTQPEGEVPQAEHILIAYFSLWENAPWGGVHRRQHLVQRGGR